MRRECKIHKVLAALVFAAACAGPSSGGLKSAPTPETPPLLPESRVSAIPKNADLVLTSFDELSFFETDDASYLKVYVDHALAGRTAIAAKSAPKKWGAALSPGRHLLRFEKWSLAPSGDWHMLAEKDQVPASWIDVSTSARADVVLIFSDRGTEHLMTLRHSPVPPQN